MGIDVLHGMRPQFVLREDIWEIAVVSLPVMPSFFCRHWLPHSMPVFASDLGIPVCWSFHWPLRVWLQL
jgi:hypothetical protein